MRTRLRSLVLVPAVALLAVGCGTQQGQTDGGLGTDPRLWVTLADLDGSTWTSTRVRADEAPADTEVRLTFEGEQLGASVGCNSLGGQVSLVEGVLEVGDLAMTEMGCPADLAAAETWLVDVLSSGPSLALDDGLLTVTSDAGVVELTSPADVALEGTTWRLDGIGSGTGESGVVSSLPAGVTAPELTLQDGRLTGSDGLDDISTDYTLDGDTLSLGGLVSTQVGTTAPAQADISEAVQGVLGAGTLTWEVTESSLVLDAGSAQLYLVAVG
ncbi:META domain-containing protein [Nocardioides bruguierae]|uniref:META domain-containing protein n=1 Tax=Nocardioides bruguierae TaxID=2945102 RepID=UPI002022236C|nr:META domain-containing protein [Nocardioides bruguierae]MCL8025678.1 META domain-containing protein [Nocardioides bruguierae]